MAYDGDLANRIRQLLSRQHSVSEKEMFGGLTFMLRGHMCCGVMTEKLVVRVGPDKGRAALKRPHTAQFDLIGKPMAGMVVASSPGVRFKSRRPN